MSIRPLAIIVSMMLCGQIQANAEIAQRHIPGADLVGQARMKVMLWNVFDARLYARDGQFNPTEPFALSLSYLRNLEGEQIVDKTIQEMQKQRLFTEKELNQWKTALSSIINDVDSSTTITGVRDENGYTVFYRNNMLTGEIRDRRFTDGFFNIWLGETTSEPKLRQDLIGPSRS